MKFEYGGHVGNGEKYEYRIIFLNLACISIVWFVQLNASPRSPLFASLIPSPDTMLLASLPSLLTSMIWHFCSPYHVEPYHVEPYC